MKMRRPNYEYYQDWYGFKVYRCNNGAEPLYCERMVFLTPGNKLVYKEKVIGYINELGFMVNDENFLEIIKARVEESKNIEKL